MKDGGGHRYKLCFTITENTYLVVGLFYDLVQPPRNICDTKFLGHNYARWSRNMPKGLYLCVGTKGECGACIPRTIFSWF